MKKMGVDIYNQSLCRVMPASSASACEEVKAKV